MDIQNLIFSCFFLSALLQCPSLQPEDIYRQRYRYISIGIGICIVIVHVCIYYVYIYVYMCVYIYVHIYSVHISVYNTYISMYICTNYINMAYSIKLLYTYSTCTHKHVCTYICILILFLLKVLQGEIHIFGESHLSMLQKCQTSSFREICKIDFCSETKTQLQSFLAKCCSMERLQGRNVHLHQGRGTSVNLGCLGSQRLHSISYILVGKT